MVWASAFAIPCVFLLPSEGCWVFHFICLTRDPIEICLSGVQEGSKRKTVLNKDFIKFGFSISAVIMWIPREVWTYNLNSCGIADPVWYRQQTTEPLSSVWFWKHLRQARGRLNLCLTLPRCVLFLRALSPYSFLCINGSTMPPLVPNLSSATEPRPGTSLTSGESEG